MMQSNDLLDEDEHRKRTKQRNIASGILPTIETRYMDESKHMRRTNEVEYIPEIVLNPDGTRRRVPERIYVVESYNKTPEIPWPDPTEEDLKSPLFNAIWESIKTWDINVPEVYHGWCGTTGNHVVHIIRSLEKQGIRLKKK